MLCFVFADNKKIIKESYNFTADTICISILSKYHRIGVSVALVSGNGSFLSLIKFSCSLAKCIVIRHMFNVVGVSNLVAMDVMSAEMTLQMQCNNSIAYSSVSPCVFGGCLLE